MCVYRWHGLEAGSFDFFHATIGQQLYYQYHVARILVTFHVYNKLTYLLFKDASNMADETVFKVLLQCFKHDQLLSYSLQLPVTLKDKRKQPQQKTSAKHKDTHQSAR